MSYREDDFEPDRSSLLLEKIVLVLAALSIVAAAVMGFLGKWPYTLLGLALAIIFIIIILARLADSGHLKKWVIFVLSIFAIGLIVSGLGLLLLPISQFLSVILPIVLLIIFASLGIALIISGVKTKDILTMVIGILFMIISILVIAIFMLFANVL